LITHLELDILILIKDAGSVREIFNKIKDDFPSFLKEMIQPAAFLEGNGPKFFSAQSRLAAREAQKNSKSLLFMKTFDLLKKTFDLLKESTLNEERIQLLARLKIVDDIIKQKEEVC
jgi:hypothetical protein